MNENMQHIYRSMHGALDDQKIEALAKRGIDMAGWSIDQIDHAYDLLTGDVSAPNVLIELQAKGYKIESGEHLTAKDRSQI